MLDAWVGMRSAKVVHREEKHHQKENHHQEENAREDDEQAKKKVRWGDAEVFWFESENDGDAEGEGGPSVADV
jgi:hypothetical protein